MKTQNILYSGLLLAIGILTCGGALADNCNGRWTNVTESAESIDLGDGHTLVIFTARGSSTSENSDFVGVGMCGGWLLTTPDGDTRLGYACARKNADGDSWSDYGGLEPGADRGTWNQSGGTGVFAGKKNTGWWQSVAADGTAETGIWAGNCR